MQKEMPMRLMIALTIGMILLPTCFDVVATTLVTSPQENLTPPTEKPAPTTGCAEWKQICYQKTYCTFRQGLREGCYRCVNYIKFAVPIYPREMERTSCNRDTVDYLKTMGYRCYQPYNNSPCLRTVQKEVCDWTCADS